MVNAQPAITKEEADLMLKIKKAVHYSIRKEFDILTNGRVERNFTSCFAAQISEQINADVIRVDPFYNKHLRSAKYLDGKIIELDIAVHERNTDDKNLVAIELETINQPVRDDIWKLEKLTQELGGYGYMLGLYVVFGVSEKAGRVIAMEWFKDGKFLVSGESVK